jgi:hypothetical protein
MPATLLQRATSVYGRARLVYAATMTWARCWLTAIALAACQQYADMKARYFTSEPPWNHIVPGSLTDTLSGACDLPLHDDSYYGFAIGMPANWLVDYSTGAVVVAPDEQEMTGALVFPARVHRADAQADQLASGFMDALGRRIRDSGGSLQLADKVTDGTIATASLQATVAGLALRGHMEVVLRPGFATLKMYWAPETELAQVEPTLQHVVACFRRKTMVTQRQPVAPPGGPQLRAGHAGPPNALTALSAQGTQPLHPYHGRFFNLDMPSGWVVRDENAHGIDIASGDGTAALGFGWYVGTTQRADAALVRGTQAIYPGVQFVTSGFPEAPPGWSIAAGEFEGQPRGVPTHGFARCAMGQGVVLSSSWVTPPARWAELSPTLQAVAASVQIQPAAVAQVQAGIQRQLASYPPIARPHPSTAGSSSSSTTKASSRSIGGWNDDQATKDRVQQGWSDSMLQQERTVSPTTGEQYTVPTNAWNDNGPQGAGYYRALPGGGSERLNVIDNYGNAQ